MSLTVSDILAHIESGADLFTIAPLMRHLISLKEHEDGYDQLLELVRNDTALSVRLLRAVNSSREQNEFDSDIRAAFDKLGYQYVRNMALTTPFLDDQDESDENDPEFRVQWVWERTLCVAEAACALAQRAGLPDPSLYRTAALLMDIGVHFMLSSFPKEYTPLVDRWRVEGGDLTDIETDSIGIEHRAVGYQLTRAWNLGPAIEQALRRQVAGDEADPSILDPGILSLAQLSAAALFEGSHTTGLERAARMANDKLGLQHSEFVDLLQRVTLIADGASVRLSRVAGPTIPYVNLLKNINQELGQATISNEQAIRELKSAMLKAEMLAIKLEEANNKLREAANIDPLTQIYNRRFFDEFLIWNFNRAQRYDSTLGCMMIDIDHFKNVNDTYGHLTGDRVLQGVAEALKNCLRNTDIVARYGGEEFVVLLPETHTKSIWLAATKLNQAVGNLTFFLGEKELKVTISVGYVAYTAASMPEISKPADLVRTADEFMYLAKLNGRNRIWPQHLTGTAKKQDVSREH